MTRNDKREETVLETLDLLAKKWHPVIVQRLLEESPLRFNELQGRLEGISAKVLTDSLDELVENDVVARTVVSEAPKRVEYELTEHGRELQSVIQALATWGEQHLEEPARPTILVVDDDPRHAKMYANWLSDDYDVRQVNDGTRALRALDDDVDLVLLDRRMPGLSGRTVLSRIRELGVDCRVMMLTAVEADFDIVDMPFDAYLDKPVTKPELKEQVRDVLERSAYDMMVLEYLSLSAKRSLLRGEMTEAELDGSDEYAELVERMEQLEAELDDPTDDAVDNPAVRTVLNN